MEWWMDLHLCSAFSLYWPPKALNMHTCHIYPFTKLPYTHVRGCHLRFSIFLEDTLTWSLGMWGSNHQPLDQWIAQLSRCRSGGGVGWVTASSRHLESVWLIDARWLHTMANWKLFTCQKTRITISEFSCWWRLSVIQVMCCSVGNWTCFCFWKMFDFSSKKFLTNRRGVAGF